MKFKFICEDKEFNFSNTTEFEAVHLSEIVQYFETFLRGSGYHFDGSFDLCHITEPASVCSSEYCDPECSDGELKFAPERCKICRLTSEQLGDHKCYDPKCGLK